DWSQRVMWSISGLIGFCAEVTTSLLSVAATVAVFWVVLFLYTKLHLTPARAIRWVFAPREWALLRTFRLATAARYGQVVLLRAPMFLVSLCAHYYAAHAVGI